MNAAANRLVKGSPLGAPVFKGEERGGNGPRRGREEALLISGPSGT